MDQSEIPTPNVKMQHDRLLVLPEPIGDFEKTRAGLHLPAGSKAVEVSPYRVGTIRAMGPGRILDPQYTSQDTLALDGDAFKTMMGEMAEGQEPALKDFIESLTELQQTVPRRKVVLEVGDRVMYHKAAGQQLILNDVIWHMPGADDIVMVLDPEVDFQTKAYVREVAR